MAIQGVDLSTYEPGRLRKVPAHLDRRPDRSFDLRARLGGDADAWIEDRYGRDFPVEFSEAATRFPMELYRPLSPDELCKQRHSIRFMMDRSVEDAFAADPRLVIYERIRRGMWGWGCGRPGWNEIVDAYEGIRRFDLGHPDFDVRLDHTGPYDEYGYSDHSRTYLDGSFGYLVHHRGEHVMTLGFSLMTGRRLLIQQVQLVRRRGNRWLYRLPANRVEHAIARFAEAFPRHRLFVADGGDVIGRSLSGYRRSLAEAEERAARAARMIESGSPEYADHHGRVMAANIERAASLRATVAHAEAEVSRLDAFYAGTGRFTRGEALTVRGLRHYAVSPGAGRPRGRGARDQASQSRSWAIPSAAQPPRPRPST